MGICQSKSGRSHGPRQTRGCQMKFLRIYLLAIAVVFLASCQPLTGIRATTITPTSTLSITNTYYFKPLPATWTPTITEVTPSATSSLTFTPSLTYTLTKTKLPTLTPLPTKNSAEAKRMLDFMIYQNGGCKLPCWWGVTPGVTKSDDMINFFQSFINRVESDETVYVDQEGEKRATRAVIFYDSSNESLEHIFEVVSVDDTVKRILVYQDLTGDFTLPNLLSTYGPPGEILLVTEAASPDNKVPFGLTLLYPDQGILVYFYSKTGGRVHGDYISICPQNTLPTLQLWPSGFPNQGKIEIKHLMDERSFQFNESRYKSIETVSNLSIDRFFATFRHNNNANCIITKAEQWWGN
jgi:hypothetical protein